MRYFVLVCFSVLSTLCAGSVFSGLNIAGVQVDVVLLIMLALALVDKTSAPIVYAAATGLFMDIMYSTVLGVYALSYTLAVTVVYVIIRKREKFNIWQIFLIGALGYLIKETVMAFLVYLLGARFSFSAIFMRYMLPTAALTGILLIPAYLIMSRIYRIGWMRPLPPKEELEDVEDRTRRRVLTRKESNE